MDKYLYIETDASRVLSPCTSIRMKKFFNALSRESLSEELHAFLIPADSSRWLPHRAIHSPSGPSRYFLSISLKTWPSILSTWEGGAADLAFEVFI